MRKIPVHHAPAGENPLKRFQKKAVLLFEKPFGAAAGCGGVFFGVQKKEAVQSCTASFWANGFTSLRSGESSRHRTER
jgi:hypothetical protein